MEIKTKKSSYILNPEMGLLFNSELRGEFSKLLPGTIDVDKIIAQLRREISNEEIEAHVYSVNNILFNITNNCNFRCKYCIYSGNYKNVRTHNQDKMDFEIARKVIEQLTNWVSSEKRRIKTNIVNIGFYGGEALLELPIIKQIIDYTRERFSKEPVLNKFKVVFHLNTNGYLLNDSIADFLVQNDVSIHLSLDGPQEEHDKFRLSKDGTKTWETIWSNLNRFKERYPDYWKRVSFLITLHPNHCFEKIDDFFLSNSDFFERNEISAYPVNTLFVKESVKVKSEENHNKQRSIINLKKLGEKLERKLNLRELNNDSQFTAMCFPGEAKIFIDSDGTFHVCERVKSDFPIGDAINGVDFDAIKRLIQQWNEEVIRNKCWECIAWSFCPVCLAQNETVQEIKMDCKYKSLANNILHNHIILKEEESRNVESEIMGDDIEDYIRELK